MIRLSQSNNIRDVLRLLFKKAEEDGLINEDERKIIDSVELSIDLYEDELKKSLMDGVLTEEEASRLSSLKKDILINAWSRAENDWHLSRDEEELIVLLQVFLANLSLPETP